jgi:calcium/calmodulin-dependent protein kinase I
LHYSGIDAVDGRDIWAIGVITYFLLCGYTPFDRESNLEEMQAILVADYSFMPVESWRGVSRQARDFINRCLTIEPTARITAHEALQHPWITPPIDPALQMAGTGEDLLPTVKKNFNARRTLHKAIDTVRALNKLREGGGLMMDGVMSVDPKPERVNGNQVVAEETGPERHPRTAHEGGGKIELDSRSHARGQTEQQIREQERRVLETVTGLWTKAASRKR